MKVEVKDISLVEKMVEFELPSERVADELEEQFSEIQREAKLRGFRPGKAPRKVVERLFKDHVREAVAKKLVEATLQTGLDRKGLKPLAQPVIDPGELVPGQVFKYTAHVEVKPEFELKDYRGLTVEHTDEKVADEDVERALEAMRESAALIREPEPKRPVGKDDQVTADVTIKEGDREIKFGPSPEQVIELWQPSWIPGLYDRLIGQAEGARIAFTAQVPDEEGVPADYRGKTLDFSFAIKGIKERILPELDDAFAREYTKHETLAILTDSIRERLQDRMADENRSRLMDQIVDRLVELNPIPAPPSLVNHEAADMVRRFLAANLRRPPREEEAQHFMEMFRPRAEVGLKANFILEAIAEREKIEALDEEVEEKIKTEAERLGLHPDKFKDRLDDEARAIIKNRVRVDKTLDFLVQEVTIKGGAASSLAAQAKSPGPEK